jgi:hypothetical protein
MSGQSGSYQRHYEVGLLDDIHNYFPALLYEPERFSNVADVLSYVRQSVANRFDLFSAGQRNYSAAAGPRLVPAASPIQPSRGGFGSAAQRQQPATAEIQIEVEDFVPRAAQRRAMPGVPLRAAQPLFPTEIESAATDLLNLLSPNSTVGTGMSPFSLLSLFNNLNTVTAGLGSGVTANFMEPVVVRPTAAQIAEATAIETVDAEEEVCAICQDQMEPGSESRVIHYCDHRFHPGCIDTWFQRDVHCPVCRHDIRELGLAAPAAAAPAAAAAP